MGLAQQFSRFLQLPSSGVASPTLVKAAAKITAGSVGAQGSI